MEYNKIEIIGDFKDYQNTENNRLYVAALLMKPGKHQYVIKVGDNLLSNTPATFFSEPRVEKLPFFIDSHQRESKWKPFKFNTSVFREWK